MERIKGIDPKPTSHNKSYVYRDEQDERDRS
jgi:hypothetical protein